MEWTKIGNLQRILAGPCSIMHTVAHNASSDTFVPRQNLISDEEKKQKDLQRKLKLLWDDS